jgi:preprotein translocase subunit SecB
MSDIGGAGNGAPKQTTAPQLVIQAQYVKDFSFENPRAPQSLMPQPTPPEIKLDINVNARTLAADSYEIGLSIAARAQRGDEPVFLIELTYAAVVSLQNANRDQTQFFLLVEAPRLLFPFARAILADATRDGGFPPLFIHPIDFADLLRRQQQNAPPSGNA